MSQARNDLPSVRRALLRWHATHRRVLPWRTTRDPYRILVSEIMLQQTRVDQVISFYRRFLRQFPSAKRLALADPAEVLRAWYGLGYNRRALRLQQAARAIAGKSFPRSARTLEALPGLGRYSANAVATFAFNAPEPLLETNSTRVLHRVFFGPELPRTLRTTRELYDLAEQVLDRTNPRRWNEALFDLGATVCLKRAPKCSSCPLESRCKATPRIIKLAAEPRERRSEPMYRGEPRRIWRGRILKELHQGFRSPAEITRELGLPKSGQDFVLRVLEQLRTDGVTQRSRYRYGLPGRV